MLHRLTGSTLCGIFRVRLFAVVVGWLSVGTECLSRVSKGVGTA